MSNPPDHLNPTILSLERTIAGMEQQIEKLKEERDEALKWKNEDPRMLREQIRVADSAFNHLNDRHNAMTKERDEWKIIAAKLRRFAKQHSYGCNDGVDSTCDCGLDGARAAYDRLTRTAKAKGGGE